MQRWLLTSSLTVAALAAVWLVPGLRRSAPAPLAPPEGARADGPVVVTAKLDEGVLLRGEEESRWLVVGLSAPSDASASRVPGDIALVVDVSGSMASDRKIDHARAAARELVGQLAEGDRFALVTFDDRATVLTSGPWRGERLDETYAIVDGLQPGGGTNIWDGLTLGRERLGNGALQRRVLLVSDGQANQGITDTAAFRSLAADWREEGAIVSTIGLGEGFNEVLLEAVADAGGGNYAFVASPSELASVVGREMDEAAATVARDLTVDVNVPAGVVAVDVPGWEWERTASGVRVFAGSLSAGQERKVVVEVKPDADTLGTTRVAEVRARYTLVADGSARDGDVVVDALVSDDADRAHASADPKVKAQATRAQASTMHKEVAALYRSGRGEEAKLRVKKVQGLLQRTSAEYAIPELAAEADALNSLGYMDDNMAAKSASTQSRGMGKR